MITPNLFCPDPKFESQIVGVLNTHLFKNILSSLQGTATSISCLHDIYEDMRLYCDCPDIDKKYMLDGQSVLPSIQKQRLMNNGYLYAGHDLPVWINSQETNEVLKTDCRIMILGRDSRRKPYEMYEMNPTQDQTTVSSPFGMHCRLHRRKTQEIPYLTNEIIRCATNCNKTVSVYITDFYKFKRTNGSVMDILNKSLYNTVYQDEIATFMPHVIILLGIDVMKAVGLPLSTPYFSIQKKGNQFYLPIPHPSGLNNRTIQKVKAHFGKPNQETKQFFAEMVCKQLKDFCCNN